MRKDSQTVRVTPETHTGLQKLKLALGHKTIDETLSYLVAQHQAELLGLIKIAVVDPEMEG